MPKKKAPTDLTKREKFENAGRFPVKKAAIIGAIVMVVAVGSFVGIRLATSTPAVGGPVVQQGGSDYSSGPVAMTVLPNVTVTGGNLQLPVAEITAKKIVGVLYNRTNPMPAGL